MYLYIYKCINIIKSLENLKKNYYFKRRHRHNFHSLTKA